MNPALLLVACGLGAVLGHAARRSIPWVLRLKSRELPFDKPWMEAVSGVLFALLGWQLAWSFGPWPYLVTLVLIAIAGCDYLVKLIPDLLTLPATLLSMLWNLFDSSLIMSFPAHLWGLEVLAPRLAESQWRGVVLSLIGALFGFILLETIRRVFGLLAGLDVMGLGDSKLALLIGAVLGPVGVVSALPLAFFLGVVHGVICLKLTGQPHSAFGPPLAMGSWLTLVAGDRLLLGIAEAQRLVLRLPLELLAVIYTVLLGIAVWLIWRTRRKAHEYEQIIEADYQDIEERLEP